MSREHGVCNCGKRHAEYSKSCNFWWVQISVKSIPAAFRCHHKFGGPCRPKSTSGFCMYFRWYLTLGENFFDQNPWKLSYTESYMIYSSDFAPRLWLFSVTYFKLFSQAAGAVGLFVHTQVIIPHLTCLNYTVTAIDSGGIACCFPGGTFRAHGCYPGRVQNDFSFAAHMYRQRLSTDRTIFSLLCTCITHQVLWSRSYRSYYRGIKKCPGTFVLHGFWWSMAWNCCLEIVHILTETIWAYSLRKLRFVRAFVSGNLKVRGFAQTWR